MRKLNILKVYREHAEKEYYCLLKKENSESETSNYVTSDNN